MAIEGQETISPSEATKRLQQQRVDLRQSEKEIETIMEQLNQELSNLDKMIPQLSEAWLKHREEYFVKLTEQLGSNDTSLTAEEKSELRTGGTTNSTIQEKREALEKRQIALPKKASDFEIIAYDAVVAALSRTLQKIDDKTIKNIVKNLSTIIKDEKKAAEELRSTFTKQCEKVIAAIVQPLEEQLAKLTVLSTDDIKLLNGIEQQLETPTKEKTELAM